ncbi:TMEM165/GDT1 family protein [Clostridium sp. 'White wine YQ']|uniref:TMEM165/GDT1 family protein n=1 Tax=Clostridium sp. 'White wine YQ' TaxID=3027474 RepID=UPI0023662780|nr:TMEM165/GDT1 family protein [Clostridium sp. 'White wine YQ']MDD7796042.1 TMEM165/GDT1 family protein [Clostridium sp. 'White wine YQ']
MAEFIKALFLVVVAEMGDKTQLLAMAMASKYKVKQVMIGVLVATVFNHALAVAVGSYIGSLIPMGIIKMVAAISFLIFGLWTLRGDKIDEDDEKKRKFGPIVTVAIAFFLAEMGDKTQLMTIAIAADNSNPLVILMGTTTGMLIADGIGIIGGAWMCRHIPEIYIKWVAGVIFMFFGTLTLYNIAPAWMISPLFIILYFLVLGVFIYIFGVKLAYHGQACDIVLANENSEGEVG